MLYLSSIEENCRGNSCATIEERNHVFFSVALDAVCSGVVAGRHGELLGSLSVGLGGAPQKQDAKHSDGPGDNDRDCSGDLRGGHRQSGTSSCRTATQ